MTETFLGFQVAGATRHFLITYADAGDADQILRANAILACCEADLATLEQWFSCNYDKVPHGIWVQVLKGSPGAGADNYGYTSSESPLIQISGTDPLQGTYVMAGAVAQMLFAAELAEILMGFTGYGWQAGNSMGEGMSRVAAAELHPAGYYAANYGPYVNAWLNANPRPDWVANTEGTDTDPISFGCAIVFLYFLRYELGFSYAQIVAAGAATLAGVHAILTGDTATEAIGKLTELLDQHLPVGTPFQVPRDNIFPLSAAPVIGCQVNSFAVGTPHSLGVTNFDAVVCHQPLAQYSYETFSVLTEVDVTASVHGLIDGTFSWSINGVTLAAPAMPPGNTGQQFITVPVEITDVAPQASGNNPPPFTSDLGITYYINSISPTKSQLLLRNATAPGNGAITISVSARETLAPDGPSGSTDLTWALTTLTYALSESYWAAMWPCVAKNINVASAALTALGSLVPLLNSPDPSPEQIAAISAAARSYLENLAEITEGAIGQRGQAASLIAAASPREPAPTVRAGADGGPPIVSPPSQARGPASFPWLPPA